MPFQPQKFLSLSIASQHKKIAEKLKRYHETQDPMLFQEIQELESWMGLDWTGDQDHESISSSFHKHQQKSEIGVPEHDLLVRSKDLKAPKGEWLESVIYLDQLRSAHNIGNILRTVEAFRLGRVCFSKEMPDIHHRAVQKTSMGAYQHIVVEKKELKDLPRPLIAIETHEKAIPLQEFNFPKTFTLALGNEEYGLSKNVLEKADYIVEIPLVGMKNSLNVAACFSILAWKIRVDHTG